MKKENTNVIISFIIVIIFIGVVGYLITNNKVEKIEDKKEVEEVVNSANINVEKLKINEEANTSQKNMETNSRKLDNFKPVEKTVSLEKIDIVVGKGEEVKAGATVSVHYTGAVAATGEIFQSSKDFGTKPVTFALSDVIKGWTEGIPGMKIGGTRRLIIPSSMAYGSTPPPGSGIPANADLVFDVELIAVK